MSGVPLCNCQPQALRLRESFFGPGPGSLAGAQSTQRGDKPRPRIRSARVTLKRESAAEVAETERKIDAQFAADKKRDEAEKRKPKPWGTVKLPEGAGKVQATAAKIEFQVASGKGKATVAAPVTELESAGWKAAPAEGDAMVGSVSLQKGDHTIDIEHVDPGIIPAESTISARCVELERKEE